MPDTFCKRDGVHCKICHPANKIVPDIDVIKIRTFIDLIKEELKLKLFGIDLIYNEESASYYCFDINPFPSFSEYNNPGMCFNNFIIEEFEKVKLK